MTVGELMCLRSSVKTILANLDDPTLDETKKKEVIRKELIAMKKFLDNNIKQ